MVFASCPREVAKHRQIVCSKKSKSVGAIEHWQCFDVDLPTRLGKTDAIPRARFSGSVVMMRVGVRPLAGMVSHFLQGICMSEMHEVAPESVNVNRVTNFKRQSTEEAGIGWVLGDRKSSSFSRQRITYFLG